MYFFNVRDERGIVLDEEGADFASLADARLEAEASARDLAKQFIDDRRPVADAFVDVLDASGTILASLAIAQLVARPALVPFTTLERAEHEHRRRKSMIVREREILDDRDIAEDLRWSKEHAALMYLPH